MNWVFIRILSGGVVVIFGFAKYPCVLLLGIPDKYCVFTSGLSQTSHSFAEGSGMGISGFDLLG